MKEFIISILIALGILNPLASADPPEVNMEGLRTVEAKAMTEKTWADADAIALAQMAWGEARGCSTMEQAATMWCVLNRVDEWGGSVISQTSASGQFCGYSTFNPVTDELYALAVDVLQRWECERSGETAVGRVLPPGYLWFTGDGQVNYFRNTYADGEAWDWSLPNPYEEA